MCTQTVCRRGGEEGWDFQQWKHDAWITFHLCWKCNLMVLCSNNKVLCSIVCFLLQTESKLIAKSVETKRNFSHYIFIFMLFFTFESLLKFFFPLFSGESSYWFSSTGIKFFHDVAIIDIVEISYLEKLFIKKFEFVEEPLKALFIIMGAELSSQGTIKHWVTFDDEKRSVNF